MARAFDPLKIFYIVILATDDPRDVTPFQGFSTSWRTVSWALELISSLPADVLEPSYSIEDVIALRMGGVRPLAWAPLAIRALKNIAATDLGVFVVLFSGEKECAEIIAAWMKNQKHPALHVSSHEVPGACPPDKLTINALQTHCREVFNKFPEAFSDEQRMLAQEALSKWAEPPAKPSGLTAKGHNITRPNYIVLQRAARSWKDGKAFIGRSEQEYTDAILETARAVLAVREEVGLRCVHFMTGQVRLLLDKRVGDAVMFAFTAGAVRSA
jgi:hypothetical protein